MTTAALEGYRAAARQTIEIVRKHLANGVDRAGLEATLEDNYPFWVSGGVARRVWRREARRFMKELGFRPVTRHELLKAHNGLTRREQAVIRRARLQ